MSDIKQKDSDAIDYCGCGLIAINLNLGMQVADTKINN